ncbi:hypothetical protein ACWELJ_25830 [Nocardia sp. NPDC004582]
MKGIDTTALRETWGDHLEAAGADREAFAILYRGRPEAVLLSAAKWERGCANVAVPEAKQQRDVSPEVRKKLRDVRAAARTAGQHTLIARRYSGIRTASGGEDELEAVIAPYDWVREALPELGEVVLGDAAQQRYRRGAGTAAADS